jgi:N-acetylneuraminate synthase/N,N'-diacetyllegionaminate synthase
MTPISIDQTLIGPGQATFIIAEIGVNHDGSESRAIELVESAARAGASAVKLQIFRADALMHPSSAFAGYQKERCSDADPAAMLRKYELPLPVLARIVSAIRSHGLIPLATPFSLSDLPAVEQLKLPAIKIASPDLVNYPLLKQSAKLGRPMLLSTGAGTLDEIRQTTAWLHDWRAPFALLHCISSYPTPLDMANLGWITDLGERFHVPVGYSDHTTEELAGAFAVMAGACIIEKHLTYDRQASGPDHAASDDPSQFARYIGAIRLAERIRGGESRAVLPIEEDVRKVSRQSIVAARDLPAGHVLAEEDLTVQRPGTGLSAARWMEVVGRKLKKPAVAGQMLSDEMF